MESKELDTFIAEKFMGFVKAEKSYYGCTHHGRDGGWYSVPYYSLDREDTWELFEEFERRGWSFTYSTMRNGVRGHHVSLGVLVCPFDSFHTFIVASGDTFSHAVCLAVVGALKLIEEKQKGTRG